MKDAATKRGGTLLFNEGDGEHEWAAASPDGHGDKGFQASSYRALCLSAGGIEKLRAIRRWVAAERKRVGISDPDASTVTRTREMEGSNSR